MSKKILIVEDEQDVREIYAQVLREDGYEVTEAWDGERGLGEALSGGYDLILLDIMLPKVDGLQILRAIKAKEELARVPVVLLTNLGTEAVIKEGFGLGAASYVIKSEIRPDQLVDEVKKVLNPQKARAPQ